jgi:hypothetical protein
VVLGCRGPANPFAADPVTLVVTAKAVELTGVAVMVEEMIAAGLTPFGVQEISNWSPD